MRAEIPSDGPCRGTDERACRVLFNFWRSRTTGPCFPLAVLRCTTHGCSFTVYPHGYVPYARHILVWSCSSGEKSFSEGKPVSSTIANQFCDTFFQAALDAAVGFAWQRDSLGETDRWWPDQRRTLAKQLRMLGVDPTLSAHERHRQAAALDVAFLFLNECACLITTTPGYRSRGAAITAVLERLVGGPCILERLLVGGYHAGLWGFPLRWDADPGVLRSLPFSVPGSRSPPS